MTLGGFSCPSATDCEMPRVDSSKALTSISSRFIDLQSPVRWVYAWKLGVRNMWDFTMFEEQFNFANQFFQPVESCI